MATTSATAALVSMSNIYKSFSGVSVLRDVRFDLRPGEVHVLAGENGAGKSTLIKILGGSYRDYSGIIKHQGVPVRIRSPRDAFACGIAVIHQELSLIPSMRVVDNIFLGNELRRCGILIDQRSQIERAIAALSRMDMELDVNRRLEAFPLAVQQMIEITKALSFDARIIVMDEPTSSLNEHETEKLFSVIRDLKAQGRGVVFISHRLEEIYRIADRITVLRDGRHISTAAASALDGDALIRLMAGRDLRPSEDRRVHRKDTERIAVRDFSLSDSKEGTCSEIGRVSFTAQAGEVLGFAGVRGSGASELFSALFGARTAKVKGTVHINGTRMRRLSPRMLIRHGCIYLSNDRKKNGFIPGMNIIHNASLASIRTFSPGLWLRRTQEYNAVADKMRELNLKADSLAMDVSALSGGNIQKVILGKWLLTKPSLMMLDDPTRGIDIAAKEEIYELIGRFSRSGGSVMLISSELQEILRLCDRIIVMHRGRVAAVLNRANATREAILKAAMGAEECDEIN